MIPDRLRSRSVGFLEREGQTWACFLVTYAGEGLRWHGYFTFRPKDGDEKGDEIRTADIFLESSEAEIDRKARGLGRPLLSGLLSSALHTHEGSEAAPPRLRRWFRAMLAENSRELAAGGRMENGSDPRIDAPSGVATEERPKEGDEEASLSELRSLYASYRMDQVAHLIALLAPEDFQEAVDTILNGQSVDFGAKDRLQFAMMVVEHIEGLLPLPPFQVWVEDYLAHRDEHRLYTHTLHREGRLP